MVNKLNSGVATLLKRAKVRVVEGWGRFTDSKTCVVDKAGLTIKAEHVILATGSEAVALPNIPFGGTVISSTEALSLDALPKKLAVIGAGYIGLELGMAFRKFGAEVTVVEATDRILPLYDSELTKPVAQALTKAGITVHLNAKAKSFAKGKLAVDGPRSEEHTSELQSH